MALAFSEQAFSEHAAGGEALDGTHAKDVTQADGAEHGAVAEAPEQGRAG
jgi:hypothetical protein